MHTTVTGRRRIGRPAAEVRQRLEAALSDANCEILDAANSKIRFRRGTWFFPSARELPMTGVFEVLEDDGGTSVQYRASVAGFFRVWYRFFGILLFWTIFVPWGVSFALEGHPRRFMERVLSHA